MPNQFRIAEIEVAKSLIDDKISGVFRFEPVGRNKQGPTLLSIVEIQSSLYVYERLLDVVNATAEQTRHMAAHMDQDPLGRFEKLVQRMNEAIVSFSAQESSPLNWGRISIFVMELSDGHFCFTGTGHLMNLFLQKQEDDTFRSFDIFGSLEQPTPTDPQKPFASIICGDVKPGDVLMVGTTNFERLRAELRIKERLSTLPPVTAALELRQDLERRSIPDDFVAAIIACIPGKSHEAAVAEAAAPEKKDLSTRSIERLREQEAETVRQLSSANPVAEINKTGQILALAKQWGTKAPDLVMMLFRSIQKMTHRDAMALTSLRGMSAGYGTTFTKKKKNLMYIIGAIVLCVLGGILWWQQSKKASAETAAWNATYDQATDQHNRAESDLVYANEARARTEIEQASSLIAALPTNTPDRKTKIDKLKKDLNELVERLKKIVAVEQVVELTALPAAANPNSLTAPLLVKDVAYAVDQASHNILKISLTSKEVKQIAIPSDLGKIVSAVNGKDSVFFASEDGELLALNKSTDLVKPLTWSHSQTSSTVDTVLYNSRLYTLDPTTSQIWRTSQSGDTFGGEVAYIKATNADVADSVALAIDSNVFVLKANGTVIEFLQGGQVSFTLATIDPPLHAASNMWTDVDITTLYITDPSEKRIVLFDKSGSLKSQITSSQFRDLRDLSVDEASKRILVTDGNRLLLVSMP